MFYEGKYSFILTCGITAIVPSVWIVTMQLHVIQCMVLLSQFCPSVCLSVSGSLLDACIMTKLNDALRIF